MSLLIDGYNLLHATDIFGKDPGNFQQSREALLEFLVTALLPAERKSAMIVFDAADAPPGLPAEYTREGISIRFARNYPDADALIEEIIEQHRAKKSLTVVSSDHRVQRSARRHGASYVDSESWYARLWQRCVEMRRNLKRSIPEKPIGDLSASEIAYWVSEFESDIADEVPPHVPKKISKPKAPENPFPPGYGEDLLED